MSHQRFKKKNHERLKEDESERRLRSATGFIVNKKGEKDDMSALLLVWHNKEDMPK